jgi:RHS repeat-associated protein
MTQTKQGVGRCDREAVEKGSMLMESRRLLARIAVFICFSLGYALNVDAACGADPSVSISVTAPDNDGEGRVNITYAFPDTVSVDQRFVTYDLISSPPPISGGSGDHGGPFGGTFRPQVASGTASIPISFSCRGSGAYKFRARATACSRPDQIAETTYDHSAPAMTVDIAFNGMNELGYGSFSVTYNFPQTTQSWQRRLTFTEDDGWATIVFYPVAQQGVWFIPYTLTCRGSYKHKYRALAEDCKGTYKEDFEFVNIDGNPSVSLALSEPDDQGKIDGTVTYAFPNTDGNSGREVRVTRGDTLIFGPVHPDVQNGTYQFDTNIACYPHVPITFKAYAKGCPDQREHSDTKTVTPDHTPEVSVTVDQQATPPVAIVSYSFPQTNSASQRTVRLQWSDGSLIGERHPEAVRGEERFNLGACDTRDKVKAIAIACGDQQKEAEADYAEKKKPKVQLTLRRGSLDTATGRRKIEAIVKYDLDTGTEPWTLKAELPSWRDADGTTHAGSTIWGPLTPETSAGTKTFEFVPPSGARQVTMVAIGQSCAGIAKSPASIDCGCDGTGNPVYFADGNMRLSDGELLPPIGGHILARTYDSDEQVVALFGRGWATLFDQRLISNTIENEPFVSIVNSSNEVVTFRGTGGSFAQVWPTATAASGALAYDSGAGTYTFRAGGSTEAVRFAASSGRLLALRDLTTGREAQVAYDAGGLPQSLTDSWSGESWNLTFEPGRRRISSISVSSRPDLVWTYSYDAGDNLTSVLGPGNSAWRTYEYVENRMTASRDARGNLIESHTYDSSGFATSSTGDVDEIASIQYDLPAPNPDDRMTRITHRSGAVVDYILSPIGGAYRPVRIIGGCSSCGKRDVTIVRDERGRTIREQSADGFINVMTYTSDRLTSEQGHLKPDDCDPATATNHCRLTPDALAAMTLEELESTSATITTSYEYGDPLWPDRVTAVITPSITAAGQARREETTYHPTTGEVLTRTTRGWSTATPPAAVTRTMQTTLYAAPDLAPAFDPGGNFQNAWLALPQPSLMSKSLDGPRTDVQDVTSFVWYPVDVSVPSRLRGKLAATKNAAGHITRFEDYDVFGNVIRAVDPNGVATETTTDDLGRPAASTLQDVPGCDTGTDPLCATDLVTTRVYSPAAGPLQSEQRPDGGATVYEYDSRGRIEAISRGPSLQDLRERIETGWDVATGQKSLERVLAFENNVWVEKKRETFAYDTLGRLQTTTHSDATFIEYTYDHAGRLSGVRDENHASANTTYEFDPAGRIAKVKQILGTGLVTTLYEYDVHGNLTKVTDPNGNVTRYTWDDFGGMLTQVSPVTGTTTYEYDAAGNLTNTTDANGAVTTRTYDALGRAFTAGSSSGSATETVSWSYDDATTGRFGIGRPAVMSDPAGSTSYFYERRGLLRREQRTFAGDSSTTTFTWDAGGNRTSIGYPSGTTVQYTFDYAGRPTGAATGGSSLASSAQYLPFGPLKSVAYGNGTQQTMQYDARYRMLENKLTAGAVTLAKHDYTLDGVGNITAISDSTDASYNRTFGYDDLNRLTSANTGAALWSTGSFTYDGMGNVLSSRIGNPAANVLAHEAYFTYAGTTPKVATVRRTSFNDPGQLSRIGTHAVNNETVTYDAAGNETSYVATRSYSPRNLLQSVTDAADFVGDGVHRVDYQYDGRGLRVIRGETQAGGTVARRYYTYSPELQLLSVTRDNGSNVWGMRLVPHALPGVKHEFVWFAGRPLVQLSPDFTDGPHWYFADHLGTPLLQTNLTREIVWHAEYEPYGDIWKLRAPVPASEEFSAPPPEQPLRFPGQDVAVNWEGTEESYNIFRWYRAGWGRMTQPDPIGFESGDTNLYAYAGENPITFADPLGLAIWNPMDIYRDFHDRRQRAQGEFHGQNQMRHCVFSCRMALQYGPDLTRAAGFVNEGQGFFMHDLPMLGSRLRGQTRWGFDLGDLINNERGFFCSDRVRRSRGCTTCETCCRESIFGNRNPPAPSPVFPSRFGPCATVNGRTVCAGSGI